MYRILYAMSVHYKNRSGQSKKECSYPVPSIFDIIICGFTPSVRMFIGQDLSLEARRAAQAERRSANTAKATTSVAAAAAAASTVAAAVTERALSASPPFFALSPPAEMDSIASPPTGASVDGTSPSIAVSLSPLVYAEDLSKGGGAVARVQGDDGVRVLSLARCCWRRGEDATINIRWEVGGGRVTKGGSR
jgi:hypothetical protein